MKFIKDRNRIVNESREISQEDLDWVYNHVSFGYINDNGEIDAAGYDIQLKNQEDITHFPIKFADCRFFEVSDCTNLKSLHNSPDKVYTFSASRCKSLVDLKGISKLIIRNLYISGCTNLRSFEGLTEIGHNINAVGCAYPEKVLISCWKKGITPDELENFKQDWEI